MSRRSDHTRDQIKAMALAAARRIVVQEGQGALSTRKIATAIGYTVGSLYLVFNNLDDLILHINGGTLDELYADLAKADARAKDPARQILISAHRYIDFAFAHDALWGLMFEYPLPRKSPRWFSDKVARMFTLIEARLHAVCPTYSASEISTAAHALWSGVHGIAVLGLANRLNAHGAAAAKKLATSLVSHYLDGFSNKKKQTHRDAEREEQ